MKAVRAPFNSIGHQKRQIYLDCNCLIHLPHLLPNSSLRNLQVVPDGPSLLAESHPGLEQRNSDGVGYQSHRNLRYDNAAAGRLQANRRG